MNALEQVIREEIARQGPIPFARFMELALYHSELGYYEREGDRIGRRGDYFTSVSVGPLFGELLAFQFAEWLEGGTDGAPTSSGACRRDADATFFQGPDARPDLKAAQAISASRHIVEAGAHDGRLAADILGWLKTNRPELSARLEYWIVEPSARRRARQERALGDFSGSVRWFPALPGSGAAPPAGVVHGVIFSNELLDAMPVHRLGWDAREHRWFEWGVGVERDRFVWVRFGTNRQPELPPALLDVLQDEFSAEICPQATAWWEAAARALGCGRLLTFDYGFTAAEWLRPERPAGTLRAYRGHQFAEDLLVNVGEQDLTAHVNFTALQTAGEAAGLTTEGLLSQSQFLVQVLKQLEEQKTTGNPWTPERTRQLHTLTHPDHLGRAFRVLVQSRGYGLGA